MEPDHVDDPAADRARQETIRLPAADGAAGHPGGENPDRNRRYPSGPGTAALSVEHVDIPDASRQAEYLLSCDVICLHGGPGAAPSTGTGSPCPLPGS
jgi:hypothetical protein